MIQGKRNRSIFDDLDACFRPNQERRDRGGVGGVGGVTPPNNFKLKKLVRIGKFS